MKSMDTLTQLKPSIAFITKDEGIVSVTRTFTQLSHSGATKRLALAASVPELDMVPQLEELREAARNHAEVTVDIFSGGGEAGTLHLPLDMPLVSQLVDAIPLGSNYVGPVRNRLWPPSSIL